MKKVLASLACALLSAALHAQTDRFISVSLGSSAPMGKYAGNTNVEQHGFAGAGSAFSLDYSRHRKMLGWSFSISMANHSLQEKALLAALPDQNRPVRFNDSSNWMAANVMFGPALHRSSGRWSAEARLLGGFFFAKAPDAVFQSEEDLELRYFKFNNNWFDCVGALGVQAGATLRYRLWRNLYANVRAHLYASRPYYVIRSKYTPESGQPEVAYKFNQNTKYGDLLWGVALKF